MDAQRFRRIDELGEIKTWMEAMAATNCLLKNVNVNVYSVDWRPWREGKMKEKQIFSHRLEEGCLKKDLKEKICKDNEAKKTP